ncbi:hypothetical protein KJ966_01120 [bacterium]|nr:hypothetical protein [bacterium]
MKDSFRIGKILKRITGLKFFNTRQTSTISDAGKAKAESYYATHKKTKVLQKKSQGESSSKDKYIRYQKELEASRLLNKSIQPGKTGKILKLPVTRKELMSLDEE